MVIRPVKRTDILALCGQSYAQSLRGLAIEHDGETVGLAGVLHTNPLQCFSEMTDRLRDSPRTIVKTAIQLRDILDSYAADIYAIASEEEPTASRFLEYVGFKYINSTHQGELYQWQRRSPIY